MWSWAPTCFARRTDLGVYSKLIFGDWRGFGSTATGRVLQWMDDISLDEETDTSYEDLVPVAPFVGTGSTDWDRNPDPAFTGGDLYSYKTGLNVEFEFDESVCAEVMIKVYLDKVLATDPTTNSDLIAPPFSTLSEPRRRLPIPLPFTLPASPPLLRKAFDLAALRDMAGVTVSDYYRRAGNWRCVPSGSLSLWTRFDCKRFRPHPEMCLNLRRRSFPV